MLAKFTIIKNIPNKNLLERTYAINYEVKDMRALFNKAKMLKRKYKVEQVDWEIIN